MNKKIAVVALALLTGLTSVLCFNPDKAYAELVYSRRKPVMSLSRKMMAMAQTVSKDFPAGKPTNTVPAPAHTLKPAVGLSKQVVGYYTEDWPGDTASLQSVNTYGNKMAGVATFSYQLKPDGQITGTAPSTAVGKVQKTGGKALALVHNYSNNTFDRNLIHSILSSNTLSNITVASILKTVKENGFDGVNVDFENVPSVDREKFNQFIALLSEEMHRYGYSMTVSVPAKVFDDLGGWGGAFDYKTIGENVDRVMLMTYDEHWFGSAPGAVASNAWVEQVIKFASTQIPVDKLLVGVGLFGYDWNVTTGKGTKALSSKAALEQANQYGAPISWDSAAQVPFYYYWVNGTRHSVWFESNDSVTFKLDMVNEYDLAGIAIWRLGFEADGFWQTVASKFSAK